jgi:lysophospholipase L1-like esterase
MSKRPPRRIHKIALSLTAIALTLLGVEVVCRVFVEGRAVKTIEIPRDDTPIRPDERLGFVLAPGDRDGTHINQLGLRGPEVARDKMPGCLRVLMLGGSTTYGNTVSTEEAYPAVAQRILQERAPDRCVEVINAGISGAHSYHHLVRYQHLYSALRPDIVTVYVGWNDYGGYLWQRGDWKPDSLAAESLVIEVGATTMTLLRTSSLARVTYTSYKRATFRKRLADLAASSDVAADLRPATEGLRQNLGRIIEIARKDGAKVLLVKFPFVLRDDRVKEEADRLATMDVPGRIEDMLPMVRFEPSMTSLVAGVYDGLASPPAVRSVDCRGPFRDVPLEERLGLFDDAIHPNARGYALLGACVADGIGALDKGP